MTDIINITGIAENIGCEQNDIKRLVSLFFSSAETTLEKYKSGVDANDIDTIYKAAHTLKGSAGTIGLTLLQNYALEVETAARNHENYDFASAYNHFKDMIASITVTE